MNPWKRKEVIGNATLYLGDCLEILPTLPKVDAVVTDPPYGINGGRGGSSIERGRGNYEGAFTAADDTPEYISAVVLKALAHCRWIARSVILTPGNKNFMLYPQPDGFGCLYQPAGGGAQRWGWIDSQPVFYYGESPLQGRQLFPCSFMVTKHDECDNGHPCPKPLSVMKKLVEKASGPDEVVLDPFMGSGTTGVACLWAGRKFIGIEIEEKYYNIAVERITNAQRQSTLFDNAETNNPRPSQMPILQEGI